MRTLILTWFAFFCTFHQLLWALEDQTINSADGRALFRVLGNGSKVHTLNPHRSPGSELKFSIQGSLIEKIETHRPNVWNLSLNDGLFRSEMDIYEVETVQNISRWTVLWKGGGPNEERAICFDYAHNKAFWYNGYQSQNQSWPMDTKKVVDKQQFNHLFDYYRHTSIMNQLQEHIAILEHLFLTSDGFAVLLESHGPWFIERMILESDNSPGLCFSVSNSKPYMAVDHDPDYLDIRIHLFAGSNIRTVLDYVVHQSELIPVPKATPSDQLIIQPTWIAHDMLGWFNDSEEVLLSDEILAHGFSPKSTVVLNEFFLVKYLPEIVASETVNPSKEKIDGLKKNGFGVGAHIERLGFDWHNKSAPGHEFLIGDGQYEYIDFSNPGACKLFEEWLKDFYTKKQIGLFMFEGDAAIDSIKKLHDRWVQMYPSYLVQRFLKSAVTLGIPVISELAFKSQNLTHWVRLTNLDHNDYEQFLSELIPSVLSVSISGYSFLMPYSAGGLSWEHHPTEEQFIRWIQAIALMPSVSISKAPWELYSQHAVDMTKKFLALHEEHAQTIIELGKRRIQDGSPIIRPMWYHAPDDVRAFGIGDQFMLGEDIVVAPVLVEGVRERMVFLPEGTWLDQHGASFTGPSEVKIQVPLEELAYFKRKP